MDEKVFRIEKKDGLALLSGGLDSTTLLWDYSSEIALAVSFDYGSKHNAREIEAARFQCEQLRVEHLIIPLDFMGRYFKSDLLLTGGEIKTGDYNRENMASTVVPFRNGIMLSIAAGLAESRELKRIFIANHSGDHFIYPDCRPEFINAIGEAISLGTEEKIVIAAPYTHISKTALLRRGAKTELDYAHTYSCYEGRQEHCGVCGTCRERRAAFLEAGIPDPTHYTT